MQKLPTILINFVIAKSQLRSYIMPVLSIRFFNTIRKKWILRHGIKEIQAEPMIISICNGAFYGGGYQIAPKSSLTDGIFDVYYADKFQKFHMLSLLPKLRKGKHEGKRYIHKFRTNHVEITTEEEVTFNVDGEKVKGTHFVLDVLPKAIHLVWDKQFVQSICQGKMKMEQENTIENEETTKDVTSKNKLAEWKQKWKASKVGKFVKRNFRNTILVLLICYAIFFMSLTFLKSERMDFIETVSQTIKTEFQTKMSLGARLNSLATIGYYVFVILFVGKEFLCFFILLALFAILKGVTGNTRASCILLFIFSLVFEIINYIVRQLRGSGITIADIFAIQTAVNVADKGMNVSITGYFIAGFFLAAIVVVLILALQKPEKKLKIWRTSRFCYRRLRCYGGNC